MNFYRTRQDVIGASIDVVHWGGAIATILRWAAARESRYVCACNVHSVVTAQSDEHLARALQAADLAIPVLQLGLADTFMEHGDPAKLLALQGLDAAGYELGCEDRGGRLLLVVKARPDACEDCLVPKEVMASIVSGELHVGHGSERCSIGQRCLVLVVRCERQRQQQR